MLNSKVYCTIPADDNFALSCLNEGVPMIQKKPSHTISKTYNKIARGLVEIVDTPAPLITETEVRVSADILAKSSRLG